MLKLNVMFKKVFWIMLKLNVILKKVFWIMLQLNLNIMLKDCFELC